MTEREGRRGRSHLMTPTTAFLTVLTVGWCALSLAAQVRPDFSGQWTSATEPAVPAPPPAREAGAGGRGGRGDMGSGWGPAITINQDASQLVVQYAFFGRGDLQPPLRFVYALDGSETKNTVMMGRGIQSQSSRAAWEGSSLVIRTVHSFISPDSGKPATVEVRQTLALESPASLVVETTRNGVLGGPTGVTRTVYRKQ